MTMRSFSFSFAMRFSDTEQFSDFLIPWPKKDSTKNYHIPDCFAVSCKSIELSKICPERQWGLEQSFSAFSPWNSQSVTF